MRFDLSVIICCYNSVSRLEPTLRHLAFQQLNGLAVELLLIDNNCSDNTVAFTQKVWQDFGHPFPLRIISENTPGLSYARNAGIAAARADIILFCDDDNWLDTDYLARAFQQMMDDDQLMILGGIGEAVYDGPKPTWFDQYQGNYAVGNPPLIKVGERHVIYLYGAGLCFRKVFFKQLQSIGFNSILVDRKGGELTSGGDTEYCLIAALLDMKLTVNHRLRFKHAIPRNRINLDYLKRWHFGYGKSRLYLNIYKHYFVNNSVPGLNLRLPLWLDTLLYKTKLLVKLYPKLLLERSQSNSIDMMFSVQRLKGEIQELFKVRNTYSDHFVSVKRMIDRYKQNTG